MRLLPFLIALPLSVSLTTLAQLPSAKLVPRVQVIPEPHYITSFLIDGREVTACHFDPRDMRPFMYPIRTTRDVSLTRMGHPHDPLTHSHHNSVWVAHKGVNGIDFWGDFMEKQGRIVTVEVSREGYEDSDEYASMRMVNHWVYEADKSVQVIETRRTEIRPIDGAKSWYMLIDIEFAPPKGKTVTFEPSGFGLTAVRVAKSIDVIDGGGRILNSAGQVNEKDVFRKPAKWVDYSGRVTNEEDGFSGITLMNHPMNPNHPTAFHVRDDGWMGACLNLDNPIEVTEEKKLRVRFGLWVHDGVPTQEQVEEKWKAFADLPVAELHPVKK